jgi:hypothetical protein
MKPTLGSTNEPPGALSRPDWKPHGECTASDLGLEQKYFLQRARRHLRQLHGWGVVCGLNVVPVPGSSGWEFTVCPGYGISPCGDEILVGSPFLVNLRDFLWTRPLDVDSRRIWLQIEACETPSAWRSAAPAPCGCGCGGPARYASRFADGFRIVIAWTEPPASGSVYQLCSGATPPCPVCPESCGLTLASVLLPSLH